MSLTFTGAPVSRGADFLGVSAVLLRDRDMLSGLLVAAAAAGGLGAAGTPAVRGRSHGGVSAAVIADGAHIALHSYPERGVLLLDVLAPSEGEALKAIEVFTRRMSAKEVRRESRRRA